jgi:transposase
MPRSKFFCEAPLACSSIFVKAEKQQQHAAVKFCFLLWKTAVETVVMLETAYKEAALGKTQVYEWFSRFRNGELSPADQSRSGRPSTSRMDENIARICELILEDRHRTDELVDLSGVSWSSCQRILSEELQMKRVAAKFVPHVLTADQKQSQVDACLELKEHLEINPDLFLR